MHLNISTGFSSHRGTWLSKLHFCYNSQGWISWSLLSSFPIAKMGDWLYCFLIIWAVRAKESHSSLTIPNTPFICKDKYSGRKCLVTGKDIMLFLFKVISLRKLHTKLNQTIILSLTGMYSSPSMKLNSKGQNKKMHPGKC